MTLRALPIGPYHLVQRFDRFSDGGGACFHPTGKEAGGYLRTSARPTLNLLFLSRTSTRLSLNLLLLRTSTRPTLNLLPPHLRLPIIFYHQGSHMLNLSQVLILLDPAER
jgi:hypothetical protein